MAAPGPTVDGFVDLSVVLTGFSAFRLRGTGQAEAHLSAVCSAVGAELAAELLGRFAEITRAASGDAEEVERQVRLQILGDPRLGPVARNVIKLWFVGAWYQLPLAWRNAYGANAGDTTFVVSADAYKESLLWPAIGANPPGAKGPGYGTWVGPPEIPVN